MLLINKVQVATADVGKALGIRIPLDAILKKPLYEINPALVIPDRANGPGATKVRQGMEFPAYFRVRLKNGQDVEIRYCTNRMPDKSTHGQTEIYTPRKVYFEGKAEFVKEDADMALYYYLHFYNKQSPFRVEGYQYFGKPFEYEFQNDAAKADAQIALIELRTKAVLHAAALEGDEMLIIAKGMGIEGIHGMEPRMVKAKLMESAQLLPAIFLEKAESQVNHVKGLIIDAIDNQIFVLNTGQNIRRWVWGKGPNVDQLIVELATSVSNHRDALISHILETPNGINEYLPLIVATRKAIKSETTIKSQLTGVDVLGMLKGDVNNTEEPLTPEEGLKQWKGDGDTYDETPPRDYTDVSQKEQNYESENDGEKIDDDNTGASHDPIIELPTSYKEAQELLGKIIGKKAPPLAKRLWDGIQSKEIDLFNIDDFIEGLR